MPCFARSEGGIRNAILRFELLTEKLVAVIEPWFDDAETIRYLGGREWVRESLALMRKTPGVEFRGHRVLARYVWVVFNEENQPVALVDAELYDDDTTALALIVAPSVRGRGIGSRVLIAFAEREELKNVQSIIGGVKPENVACLDCLRKVGFTISEQPDEEGMLVVEKKLPKRSA